MKSSNKLDRREAVRRMALAMGVAVTAPSITTFLSGCDAPSTLAWKPISFTDVQARSLSAIVDMVLPDTQTPGALSMGVPQMMDGFLTEIMSKEDRDKFKLDLDQMLDQCKKQLENNFEDCSFDQKVEFLTMLENDNKKGNPAIWGADMAASPKNNFFWQIKGMTVWMYTLNEEVGERILSYDPIPGSFQACIPVSEVGNVWSL